MSSAGTTRAQRVLRFVCVFLAVCGVGISLVSVAAVVSAYDGRAGRDLTRSEVAVGPGRPATVRTAIADDSVRARPVVVIYIEPVTADALPPPGVARWPQPGEVLLSPQLLTDGASEGIRGRYGRFAGVIGLPGLANPTELLAYVRPTDQAGSVALRPIAGYGVPVAPILRGDTMYSRSQSDLFIIIASMLFLPSLAVLVMGCRLDAESRDRRLSLLDVLGVRGGQRVALTVFDLVAPIIAGTLATAVLAGWFLTTNVSLPLARFRLLATDMQADWPGLVAAVLATPIVVLVVVTVVQRRRRSVLTSPRPVTRAASVRPRLIAAFIVACLFAFQIVQSLPAGVQVLALAVSAVVAAATLPAVLSAASVGLGLLSARLGRAVGDPASTVAGRKLAAQPTATTRLIASVAVGMILLVTTLVWISKLNGPAIDAQQIHAELGTSIVTVTPGRAEVSEKAITEAVPEDASVLRMQQSGNGAGLLVGSCDVLSRVGLPCDSVPRPVPYQAGVDRRIVVLAQLFGGLSYRTDSAAPATTPTQLVTVVVLSNSGDDLAMGPLKTAMARLAVPPPPVQYLAEGYRVGAQILVDQSRWIPYFGVPGLTLLAVGALITIGTRFVGFGTSLAPIGAMGGRAAFFLRVAVTMITVPFIVSVILGAAVSAMLTSPLTEPGAGGVFPTRVVATTALLVALSAVVIATGAGLIAHHRSQKWRPEGVTV